MLRENKIKQIRQEYAAVLSRAVPFVQRAIAEAINENGLDGNYPGTFPDIFTTYDVISVLAMDEKYAKTIAGYTVGKNQIVRMIKELWWIQSQWPDPTGATHMIWRRPKTGGAK